MLWILPAALMCAAAVQADPPPGKGWNKGDVYDHNASGKGNGNGNVKKNKSAYDDRDHGQGKNKQDKNKTSAGKSSTVKYSDRQSDGKPLIRAGISIGDARALATELHVDRQQYTALPPGIAKNLARGKPLPPGIAKKYAPAPMVSRLPHYPGYEWRVAGTSLALVYSSSGIVADVLLDIF